MKKVTGTTQKEFKDGNTIIIVEVVNTSLEHRWRLKVGTRWGPWSAHYAGVYHWQGYCYCTQYWLGTLPTEMPFKVQTISVKDAVETAE